MNKTGKPLSWSELYKFVRVNDFMISTDPFYAKHYIGNRKFLNDVVEDWDDMRAEIYKNWCDIKEDLFEAKPWLSE